MDHALDFSTTLPSATDLESTINQIKGIYASCVILDGARHVNEIHIVASNARKPKPIIRDIETMLLVKHSTKIDYRAISMVQIPDGQLLRIPIARPEIREVKEEPMGDRMRVRVMIRGAGRIAKGEAFEKIDNPSPFRTSALATINAIEKLLNSTIDVRLEDAQTFRLGVREVLVVIVTSLIDGREETFVGSSFVSASLVESAARATLDALNRRIDTISLQAARESEAPESV